jgi:hypothetical protein
MCTGCMGTADFLFTGGVLSAASLKVAGHRLLPGLKDRDRRKVTDAEAEAFVTRVRRQPSDEPAPSTERDRPSTTSIPGEPAAPAGVPVPV